MINCMLFYHSQSLNRCGEVAAVTQSLYCMIWYSVQMHSTITCRELRHWHITFIGYRQQMRCLNAS